MKLILNKNKKQILDELKINIKEINTIEKIKKFNKI
jgi:hypothetical protein